MNDLLRRVVDDFGGLTAVYGATSEPIGPGQPSRFEEYTFEFENGSLTVAVDTADDTIQLIEGSASSDHRSLLTGSLPWSGALGCGALWLWILTNHSGFVDGFQIAFGWGSGSPSGNLSVQLVCEASALTACTLQELDDQLR